MAWLTNKKTGAKFNTEWLEKEKQIAYNKAQADKRNEVSEGESSLYEKLSNKEWWEKHRNDDKIEFDDENWIIKREDGKWRSRYRTKDGSYGIRTFDSPEQALSRLKQVHKKALKEYNSNETTDTKSSKKEHSKVNKDTSNEKVVKTKPEEDFYDRDLTDQIGKRGEPKDIREATKATNPNYRSTKYPYVAYHQNCQRCVIAYEMNRRGYDVEAKPKQSEYDSFGNVGSQYSYARCLVTEDGSPFTNKYKKMNSKTASELRANIRKEMESFGEGSRAVLKFGYTHKDTAHVTIVEFVGGKLKFIDPQMGISNNWENLKYDHVNFKSAMLVRTDDKKITSMALEAVKKKGSKK